MVIRFEDLPKLVQKIRAHLVLLYDSTTPVNASGVLIEMNNHIFVLTAAHVLNNFNELNINLGLDFQKTNPEIINSWYNLELDIGFVELKAFDVNILKIDKAVPFQLNRKKANSINVQIPNIAICGYPFVNQTKFENKTGFTPVFFKCVLLHPDKWPQELSMINISKKNRVAVPYGPKHLGGFYDSKGNLLDKIEPYGMSGCGIWYYSEFDSDIENPSYSLLGIQSSYVKSSQVLIGSLIEPLIDEIIRKYGFELPQ